MDLQKEFLSGHCLLGAARVLRAFPFLGGVCAGTGRPDRLCPRTFYERTGTDVSYARNWHGNDDHLYATATNGAGPTQTQIASHDRKIKAIRLTAYRPHGLMRRYVAD